MNEQNKKVPTVRFKGFTNDWEQRKLSSIAHQTFGGGTPSKSNKQFWNGDFPWIQSSDLAEDTIRGVHPNKFITQNALLISAAKKIPKNSIAIVSRVGVGKVALIPFNYSTSQDFLSLSGLKINSQFATYSIHKIMKKTASQLQGTSIKGITKKDILNKTIIFPISEKEQVHISSLLKYVDYIISLQQRKLALLKQLKKGFLQKMFADKDSKQPILRFKGFHDDWEQRKLSKVKDVRDGTHDSPKYHEKGFPLITSKNLTPSGVDFSDASLIDEHDYQEINKRSLVEIHDILFGMIGTIGNPVIVKKSGFAIKNVALIKHGGNLSNYFLLNLLNSPIFAKYINKENAGGTQKFLSLSIIRNFRFLAPGSDEQNKIGNMFEQVDTFITLQQQKLAKYQSIKKSLLQQMFI